MADKLDPMKPLFKGPSPAELNERAKEVWERAARLADKRMNDYPSAAKAATDEIARMIADGVPGKYIPSFESLLLSGSNSFEQSRRAELPRNKQRVGPDEIDALIVRAADNLAKTGRLPKAPEVWATMVKLIEGGLATAQLSVGEDEDKGPNIIWSDEGGQIRKISKSSLSTIFSKLRKKT